MRYTGIALLGPILAFALTGCATKDFVRQMVSKSEVALDAKIGEQGQRIDEQTQRIEAQAKTVDTHSQQLDTMGTRVAKLETTVDETGTIARQASAKADEASARVDEVSARVTKLLANRNARQLVETIEIQFAFDRADLSDGAQTALAALIRELAENPALTVDLEGYTDRRGTADYNVRLSERRAAAVRRFLVQHGVDLFRINWIGMGERTPTGTAADDAKSRRVTLRLMVAAQ
jgi:outer membrane protein OmpA-like peptidoglycan-associated protein